ncbi:protein ANTAGONIST OF LIKE HETEROCHROMATIN PROTEIN 1-like [Durio zibethinus]|uniref:Protein ANTAGONIST OF LIKE HETEROCHROMATIN PROTEIN 1-like n=1 Tax=Durio zibethinus TaxID=66656 RepID=A0A6P6B2F9_DURZI|nr:protein ANTAGONIST OF LIKE HETEROCHROMATIN PROTEIN 1-like [Durio zibethinus]
MVPTKKSKKTKKSSKKLKKNKSVSMVPVEPRVTEPDWWVSFWHKNSTTPGLSIPSNEEEGFKYFFRVARKTFDYICSLVREDLVSRPPSGLINIEGRLLSVEKQVAIALRRLASCESQVSVGVSFGVGQSTVSQVTWRFIEALEERAKHHLKWPDSNRMEDIKLKFEASFGLPNCCGAVDATHIIMTLPAVQTSDDWCDQESNYSMFLQGIVDHEMRFLDIVTGWPGGMSVSRLLKCSGFFRLCEARDRLNGRIRTLSEGLEMREFIVGGAAYPLLPWLITPYEINGLSSFMSINFNASHEVARLLAVRAFLQLKGSWRILNKVMWRPDKRKLPSIILVCCLLHNIIIDSGDQLHPDVALSGHHDLGYGEQCCKQVDLTGKTMRENLAKYLSQSKRKLQQSNSKDI